MKSLPTPHRFLPAWVPLHRHAQPPGERTEPVLGLAPRPCRADIERALDEGSRRVYQPRSETEVIERRRRR